MLPRGTLAGALRALVVLLVLGLGATRVSAADFAPRGEGRYAGAATLVVHHLDDTGAHLETRTYGYDVVVLVGPPRRFGREEEANPLHLEVIAPAASLRTEEGRLGMTSASTFGGLRRHWTLRIEGNRLDGQLTDEEQGTLSLILDEENHLNTRRTMGYAGFVTAGTGYDTLAHGSTLVGTVDEDRVWLRIEGNVTSRDRVFEFEVDARRVDALGRPMQPEVEAGAPDPAAQQPPAAATPAPAAAEGGNPLAPANPLAGGDAAPTDPFVGRFAGDGLVLTLALRDGRHAGEIEHGALRYPVDGIVTGGVLGGTFESGGQRFAFEATLDGDTLLLATAGVVYRLARETPPNPLGR